MCQNFQHITSGLYIAQSLDYRTSYFRISVSCDRECVNFAIYFSHGSWLEEGPGTWKIMHVLRLSLYFRFFQPMEKLIADGLAVLNFMLNERTHLETARFLWFWIRCQSAYNYSSLQVLFWRFLIDSESSITVDCWWMVNNIRRISSAVTCDPAKREKKKSSPAWPNFVFFLLLFVSNLRLVLAAA